MGVLGTLALIMGFTMYSAEIELRNVHFCWARMNSGPSTAIDYGKQWSLPIYYTCAWFFIGFSRN
jgi:hypothetical protein